MWQNNLNTISTVTSNNSVDGTLIKINSTISKFLDQTMRAFEDGLIPE